MAKTGNTKMTLSLDPETKRLLRNLTKAVDRLARSKWEETKGASGVKRLSEPGEDQTLQDLQDRYTEVRGEETRRAWKGVFGGG